jgi:hypothetical protein
MASRWRATDPQVGSAGDDASAAIDESAIRIGFYLGQQRRLRGISREELCQLTRIPPRSLERLEDGVFDDLNDGFVRGFVRTVSDALGLDSNDTLARMSPEPEGDPGRAMAAFSELARYGVLLLGGVLLAGVAGLLVMLLRGAAQPDAPQMVKRRDPVRILAEAYAGQGIESSAALVPAASTFVDEMPMAAGGVPVAAELEARRVELLVPED